MRTTVHAIRRFPNGPRGGPYWGPRPLWNRILAIKENNVIDVRIRNVAHRDVGLSPLLIAIAAWLAVTSPAPAQQRNTDKPAAPAPRKSETAVEDHSSPTEQGRPAVDPASVTQVTQEESARPDLAVRARTQTGRSGPLEPTADYGLWVLVPALVAILLAIFMRQVVPALVAGILVGAYMILPCLAATDPFAGQNSIVGGFRLALERYVLGAIHEAPSRRFEHLQIIVFTLLIGFLVGVIGRNGGTRGMVNLVTGQSRSPRRGALTAWLAGLVVFFDDYANTMIIGPTMRPVFDRLKLSRAKLAYIVDSTAAPVSSIALIGTWVGTEVGLIDQGLKDVAANTGMPLVDPTGHVITGMQAFLASIPYRFYPFLALLLVFLIALTGRDFGPMKRAERRALRGAGNGLDSSAPDAKTATQAPACWWLGCFPVAALVLATVGVLVATGSYATAGPSLGLEEQSWWQRAADIFSRSDPYRAILYGAVLASFVAVFLTLFARACPMRDAVDAGLEGMARMMPAIVILVLAWALSSVLQDLKLGAVVAALLREQGFSAQWLPLAVFVTAAFVSFATGTSWGTMGILCPMTVATGAGLVVGLDPVSATHLLYAAIGSVLAGAVFGDHCSPISDTTVLSSIASGCRHEEHVWTQIPYALIAAVAAMGLGDVLCSVYKQPWYYGMGAGAVFLVLVVFLVGRQPRLDTQLADARATVTPLPPGGGAS